MSLTLSFGIHCGTHQQNPIDPYYNAYKERYIPYRNRKKYLLADLPAVNLQYMSNPHWSYQEFVNFHSYAEQELTKTGLRVTEQWQSFAPKLHIRTEDLTPTALLVVLSVYETVVVARNSAKVESAETYSLSYPFHFKPETEKIDIDEAYRTVVKNFCADWLEMNKKQ